MTELPDPFDTIFGADEAHAPRPEFANQLHRQLLDAAYPPIDLPPSTPGESTVTPGESTVTTTDQTIIDQTPRAASEGVNIGSLFYFTLPAADPARAAAFYQGLFGWDLEGGDHGFHVQNVYPPMGLASNPAPTPEVWIEVADIDAAVAAIRDAGGTAEEPTLYDSGWNSACTDGHGVKFNVTVPRVDYRSEARRSTASGELFYWTLPAPDAARSKRFFNQVFGWEFGTPGSEGGMHVENRLPDGGLGGGREGTHPDLFFRVADLEASMEKVRALGGTAEPAGDGDEGRHAMCVDDQGVPFGISQPAEGY